jgi:2-polyprenyl-3-methyl-5-hydroxy-6-metoxy-1,4-benzoquinol methylase
MDSNFLSLLVHPVYKTPLQFDKASGQLVDNLHNDRFAIKENVPLLLTTVEEAALTQTEQHKDAGSKFHYKEHYQHDAETYDYFKKTENPIENEEHNRLHQYILSEIPAAASWVLDTGCGGGWLAGALKNKNKNVISMDISDINPIKATKNLPYPTHYGLVADVYELPLKDASMDYIVASEIIEHVSDPKRFLDALFTALKPGGKIIVTTPYNERILESLCIHCNHLTPHNAHLHSFTEASIQKCLPQGIKSFKTTVFNNKVLVRLGIQRLLGFLPMSIYKGIDQLTNGITKKKAYRLMLVIEK